VDDGSRRGLRVSQDMVHVRRYGGWQSLARVPETWTIWLGMNTGARGQPGQGNSSDVPVKEGGYRRVIVLDNTVPSLLFGLEQADAVIVYLKFRML
jgi:hypothetical protein